MSFDTLPDPQAYNTESLSYGSSFKDMNRKHAPHSILSASKSYKTSGPDSGFSDTQSKLTVKSMVMVDFITQIKCILTPLCLPIVGKMLTTASLQVSFN